MLAESTKNGVCNVGGKHVENSPESHKAVEIGDSRAQGDLRSGRPLEGPNRPTEAADGPLRGRERGD